MTHLLGKAPNMTEQYFYCLPVVGAVQGCTAQHIREAGPVALRG